MENSKIIKENQRAIGFIDVLIPDKSDPKKAQRSIRGTGFFVSTDGKFLTNAHVYLEVKETEREFLGFNVISQSDEKGITSYRRYPIEMLKLDQENDLALFKIKSDPNLSFDKIRQMGALKDVNEGDEVLIMGHPLATELLMMGVGITAIATQCIVSSIKRKAIDGSLHFFFVGTHINLGSSGSPVFSKKTGELIGIVSARIGTKIPLPDLQNNKAMEIPANIGICRPVEYLKELINK